MCEGFVTDKRASRLIASSTQGSRFLLMDGAGEVGVFGRWVAKDGVLYSNLNHLAAPRRPRRDGTRTARGASSTRSWASTPRPRTSRSSGCSPRASPAPLLEECAEYLPYCADEAQAAETADAILA